MNHFPREKSQRYAASVFAESLRGLTVASHDVPERAIGDSTETHANEIRIEVVRPETVNLEDAVEPLPVGTDIEFLIKGADFLEHFTPNIDGRVRRHPTVKKHPFPKRFGFPVPDHLFGVVEIHVAQIPVNDIDLFRSKRGDDLLEDFGGFVEVVGIEETDHFSCRESDPFSHGIVNPLVTLRSDVPPRIGEG